MVTSRSKSLALGCLFLGMVLCLAGVVGVSWYKKSTECFKVRPPLSEFDVTINKNQGQVLVEQLRKFADKNDFEFQLSIYTPNGEDFSVWMKRKDVEVIVRNPFTPEEFKIGFYNYDCIRPTVASDIGDLEGDLRNFINEIPNVMITEVRDSLHVTLDTSQREELFTQMRKLADEHSLEFTLSLSSDKTVFHVDLHGEGFHITSAPVTGSPREIEITFFIDYYQMPTPASLEAVDQVFTELKSLVREIPNATIEEK